MRKLSYMCFIAVAAMLTGCNKNTQSNNIEATPVKTQVVGYHQGNLTRTYVGTIEESEGSLLSFATLGTVKQVNVEEGAFVHRGQILALLDATTARNSHAMAKATLQQAQDAYSRLHTLYNKGSLPEIKWVEIQTKLAEAQAAERIARKTVEDCVLKAPFDGYIAARSVDMGNNVAPGMTCFKLVKIEQVKVKLSVPEGEIAGIKMGQTVNFTVAALNNASYTAKIVEKGVQANVLSHTYEVRAELANKDHKLLPGMVCSVQMQQTNSQTGIIIPQDAVLVEGNTPYVWIARNGKAHRQNIVTGDVCREGVIVSSGLQAGDSVFISGQNRVSEGVQIKIVG